MHLINPNALARDFASGKMDEREKMKHLLILVFLIAANGFAGTFLNSRIAKDGGNIFMSDAVLFSQMGLILLVNVAGVIFAYKANQAGDGKDFIARFICFALPLGIWYAALGFFTGAAAGIMSVEIESFKLSDRALEISGAAVDVFLSVIFYLAMRYYVSRVSQSHRKPN